MAADTLTGSHFGARIAYAVFGTHLAAAIAMVVVLRNGLPDPSTTAADRLNFIQQHTLLWSLGWLLWQLAALCLLALYTHLALRWWSRAPILTTLALLCAAAGIGADVSGQSLYMGMPARLDAAAQARLEIAAGLITGYAANGLYTAAGALLTLAGRGELPRRVITVSILLWTSGFALAAASLAHSILLQQITTGTMLLTLFAWTLMLATWLRNEEL